MQKELADLMSQFSFANTDKINQNCQIEVSSKLKFKKKINCGCKDETAPLSSLGFQIHSLFKVLIILFWIINGWLLHQLKCQVPFASSRNKLLQIHFKFSRLNFQASCNNAKNENGKNRANVSIQGSKFFTKKKHKKASEDPFSK